MKITVCDFCKKKISSGWKWEYYLEKKFGAYKFKLIAEDIPDMGVVRQADICEDCFKKIVKDKLYYEYRS